MSIVREILYALSNYPGGYRVIYDIIYDSESPTSSDREGRKKSTLHTTLSRLKKKGLINKIEGKWSLSKEGKEFLKSKSPAIKKFFPSHKKSVRSRRNTIIVFDIPEKERRFRDWLRSELIGFGFDSIQKSVWFGPALPKEFIEYLDQEGLLKYIRFFRASEDDII